MISPCAPCTRSSISTRAPGSNPGVPDDTIITGSISTRARTSPAFPGIIITGSISARMSFSVLLRVVTIWPEACMCSAGPLPRCRAISVCVFGVDDRACVCTRWTLPSLLGYVMYVDLGMSWLHVCLNVCVCIYIHMYVCISNQLT